MSDKLRLTQKRRNALIIIKIIQWRSCLLKLLVRGSSVGLQGAFQVPHANLLYILYSSFILNILFESNLKQESVLKIQIKDVCSFWKFLASLMLEHHIGPMDIKKHTALSHTQKNERREGGWVYKDRPCFYCLGFNFAVYSTKIPCGFSPQNARHRNPQNGGQKTLRSLPALCKPLLDVIPRVDKRFQWSNAAKCVKKKVTERIFSPDRARASQCRLLRSFYYKENATNDEFSYIFL